jgi:hypothetical protein
MMNTEGEGAGGGGGGEQAFLCLTAQRSAAQSDAATVFLLLAFAPDEQKGRYPLARSRRDSS